MAEPCFHCEIAKLREEKFPAQLIEESIHDLLELVADWISGESLDEQLRLFEWAEREMMKNRNEVLGGLYKFGVSKERAIKGY
jgi:hypothetical protein